MFENDLSYYRRRAAAEQEAAERSSNYAVAQAHRKMAEHYSDMVQTLSLRQPQ